MEQEHSNLDINLLLEAIKTYDYYTETQRLILQIIVQTSVNGCSKITTSFLAEKANVSRTAVYKCLKKEPARPWHIHFYFSNYLDNNNFD